MHMIDMELESDIQWESLWKVMNSAINAQQGDISCHPSDQRERREKWGRVSTLLYTENQEDYFIKNVFPLSIQHGF